MKLDTLASGATDSESIVSYLMGDVMQNLLHLVFTVGDSVRVSVVAVVFLIY